VTRRDERLTVLTLICKGFFRAELHWTARRSNNELVPGHV